MRASRKRGNYSIAKPRISLNNSLILPKNMHVCYTCIQRICNEGVSSIPSRWRDSVLEWFSMLLLVWLWAARPNYSGACGMSYCALPVYFRPGSVCINTQAKQEGREQKHQSYGGIAQKQSLSNVKVGIGHRCIGIAKENRPLRGFTNTWEGNVSLTLISGVLEYYHLFSPTSKGLSQKWEEDFVSWKLLFTIRKTLISQVIPVTCHLEFRIWVLRNMILQACYNGWNHNSLPYPISLNRNPLLTCFFLLLVLTSCFRIRLVAFL